MESFENGIVSNISVPMETISMWNISFSTQTTGIPVAPSGHGGGHSSAVTTFLYYFCLVFVLFPGFVTNTIALGFIIRDVQKAIFPAIILLLALCSADLAAVMFTTIQLSLTQYLTGVTYAICAVLSVINTFFRLYSGILNMMMCIDRVMAICAPYFYKSNIHVATWKYGILASSICTAMFTMFPVIGLGDVVRTMYINGKPIVTCSTFDYREEAHKKVFAYLYCIFGLLIIIIIVVGNCMVIRSVFKMRQKIVGVNAEPSVSTDCDSANKVNSTSFEVAFAKLMGGLAIVYLLSGAPYSVSIHLLLFLLQWCRKDTSF